MKPIFFKGFQESLGAPPNWNAAEYGECEILPIRREYGCIYSCWKPSFRERLKLIFGQPITMIVAMPQTQPPISLNVGWPCGKGLKP